ncbi:MAG: hypothetical protein KJ995_08115 [Candidatus Omnitrophica bacterium]|nr:hypothetical protein [Candidatus Omnitrophota bacterium]
MGFGMGGGDPGAWLAGALQGAVDGISKIGINYLFDELDLPPIVEQMGAQLLGGIANSLVPGISSTIFHAVNSFTGHALAVPDKPYKYDPKYWSTDGQTFNENAYVNDMANWSWQNTGYQQMSEDLTQAIRDRNMQEAIDIYGGSLFDGDMLDAIDTHGLSAGTYLQNQIDAQNYTFVDYTDGVQLAKVDINDNTGSSFGSAYFAYDDQTGFWNDLYGYEYGDFMAMGDLFVSPYNDLRYFDGKIIETVDGYIVEQMFTNGMQDYIQFKDLYGEVVLNVTPTAEGGSIYVDSYGNLLSGNLSDGLGYSYYFSENGEILDFKYDAGDSIGGLGFSISGDSMNNLLYSTIENGKITVDSLSISDNWLNVSNEAGSTDDISNDIVALCDSALGQISQGQDVDFGALASQSEWQDILGVATDMASWSQTSGNMFLNAMTAPLAPGTNVFANILGNDSFKQELLGQANDINSNSSYYKELAEIGLGILQPGSSTLVDSINTTGFWEGLKSTAMTLWDKRDVIVTTTGEVAQFITNPSQYLSDRFWTSEIGSNFMTEIENYYGQTDLTNEFLTIATNAATGGAGQIFDIIGYDNMWSGFQEATEFVWDNRGSIIGNATEMYAFATDPFDYMWNIYSESEFAKNYNETVLEFFALDTPTTLVNTGNIGGLTYANVDADLNWVNIMHPTGIPDVLTLLSFANPRWDKARDDATIYYENQVSLGTNGIAVPGINDDGSGLTALMQDLLPGTNTSFTIAHSAGNDMITGSGATTDKVISISPQCSQEKYLEWMSNLGKTSDQVLIVDTKGDLPFRPIDVIGLEPYNIINPFNVTDPIDIVNSVIDYVNIENAYMDYGQNVNNQYTYIRIVRGPGVGIDDPVVAHSVGINGAVGGEVNGIDYNNAEYDIEYNGQIYYDKKLKDLYENFLDGTLEEYLNG